MFLTKAQLVELTGYKRPSSICVWLADHGWVFVVGADGYPRVDRRYYDQRMIDGCAGFSSEPDYGAMEYINGSEKTH
jgi:hypothetical protein